MANHNIVLIFMAARRIKLYIAGFYARNVFCRSMYSCVQSVRYFSISNVNLLERFSTKDDYWFQTSMSLNEHAECCSAGDSNPSETLIYPLGERLLPRGSCPFCFKFTLQSCSPRRSFVVCLFLRSFNIQLNFVSLLSPHFFFLSFVQSFTTLMSSLFPPDLVSFFFPYSQPVGSLFSPPFMSFVP